MQWAKGIRELLEWLYGPRGGLPATVGIIVAAAAVLRTAGEPIEERVAISTIAGLGSMGAILIGAKVWGRFWAWLRQFRARRRYVEELLFGDASQEELDLLGYLYKTKHCNLILTPQLRILIDRGAVVERGGTIAGAIYELHPHARKALEKRFPNPDDYIDRFGSLGARREVRRLPHRR